MLKQICRSSWIHVTHAKQKAHHGQPLHCRCVGARHPCLGGPSLCRVHLEGRLGRSRPRFVWDGAFALPKQSEYQSCYVFHCLSMLERWTMMDALNTQKASEWGVFDFGLPMAAYGCLWLRLPCWICVHLRSMACSIWGLLQQLGDPGFMEPWSHGPWMRIESTKTIDTAWYSMIMNDIYIWMIQITSDNPGISMVSSGTERRFNLL
jgi:hypothetical protein